MHRPVRRALTALVATLTSTVCVATTSGGVLHAEPSPPNLVLIYTDDQTVDDLRFMPKTKELLGGAGVEFTNSYVSLSLCCPARATILTGQHAQNTGVWSNALPTGSYRRFDTSSAVNVALQTAGYTTIHIGKFLHGTGRSRPPGWSDWQHLVGSSTNMYGWVLDDNGELIRYGASESEYQTDVLAERGAAAIGSAVDSGRPFFLHLAPSAPHVGGGNIPPTPPRRYLGTVSDRLPRSPAFNVPGRLSETAIKNLTTLYQRRAESLRAVDDLVETIVRRLESEGVLDDTLIMFTSDNGYLLGEHGLVGKVSHYEPSMRVPLLVRGPGFPAGLVSDVPVQNIDYAPTLLAAAGASPLLVMDGLPLGEVLDSGDHRGLLMMSSRTSWSTRKWWRAIHTNRWMYVEWADGRRQLYDFEADPWQMDDQGRAPSHVDVRNALAAILDSVKACSGDDCWFEVDDRTLPAVREQRTPSD